MTYLARGNVALSVTMTTLSTMLAPVMTPLATGILAGQYVPVKFWLMMKSIALMIVIPVLAGLVLNRLAGQRGKPLLKALPILSMAGICLSIAIITSHSRDALLGHGATLMLVAVLHNAFGYIGGYWGARLVKLDEVSARTVSLEVGLQNGGMASGLAIEVLRSPNAALAPALFGFWMNVSGSLLASWWRNRIPAAPRHAVNDPAE
jgi:BASS family bile acid:Na+ symporter